jgi:manganese-dependent inorganic pyrophosphatase
MRSSRVYVIGHVNPDTDSIAAAMGYAWCLRERDNVEAVAARAGAINPQTAWALRHFDLEAPVLLTDLSPRFESVMRRLDTTTPDRPLRDAWAIASRAGGIAPVINPDGTPYGMVTGRSFFEYLGRFVGTHPHKQLMKISDILELPCNEAADKKVLQFQATARIRDVINRILRAEEDEFWVVDEHKHYVGICRQRDVLNPPRLKVILVDHNEAQQAVAALEEADLIEILDHHRLGNPSTHIPIRFTVDVVGSTSTLVTEKIENAGLSAPSGIAGILLAGLLTDTLILNSPTTTERDHLASERLARWAFGGGSPYAGDSIDTFGRKLLSASAGIGARSPEEIVRGDMKVYNSGEYKFLISQVEVSDLYEVDDHLSSLTSALKKLCVDHGLVFSMLMVTDIVRGSSRLLLANPPALLDDLPYPPAPDGTRLAEGVVSRKKQLLPVVLGLLED